MSYTYKQRLRPQGRQNSVPAQTADAAQTNLTPTAADKGSRVDLPDAMRAKMENAFGADLSAVKLYESRAVADAGAEAVARGSEIAFAPGKFDLSSAGGQALLGHELSHVVSQQRGEVRGSGFLNDRALEARADREGAMAAAGQQVFSGPVTGAMSAAAPAVAAAAPMQAARKKDKDAARANADMAMMRRGGAEEAAEQDADVSYETQASDLAEAQRIEDEVRESGMGESAKKMTLIYSISQSRSKKRERGLDPGEGGFSDEDIAWYNAITEDKNQREGLVSTLQKLNVAKKLRAHAAWEKLGGKNATEEDRVKLVHGDDSTDSDSYERMMNHIWMNEENDQLQNQMAANIRQYSDSLSPETRKKLDDFNEMSKEAYLSKLVDTGVADEYGDKATPYKKQLEEAQDQRYQKLYDKKYDSSKRWWQFWK